MVVHIARDHRTSANYCPIPYSNTLKDSGTASYKNTLSNLYPSRNIYSGHDGAKGTNMGVVTNGTVEIQENPEV